MMCSISADHVGGLRHMAHWFDVKKVYRIQNHEPSTPNIVTIEISILNTGIHQHSETNTMVCFFQKL